MSQVVQYRCPKCLKLLFKFDRETGKVEYHMSQYAFYKDEQDRAKHVSCPKCKTELEIVKNGMIERPKSIQPIGVAG